MNKYQAIQDRCWEAGKQALLSNKEAILWARNNPVDKFNLLGGHVVDSGIMDFISTLNKEDERLALDLIYKLYDGGVHAYRKTTWWKHITGISETCYHILRQ